MGLSPSSPKFCFSFRRAMFESTLYFKLASDVSLILLRIKNLFLDTSLVWYPVVDQSFSSLFQIATNIEALTTLKSPVEPGPWLMQAIAMLSNSLPLIPHNPTKDKLHWSLNKDGIFSVSSLYHLITLVSLPIIATSNIWTACISENQNYYMDSPLRSPPHC